VKGRNAIFIHYVSDMERSRRFYETVFGVVPSFASSGWTTLDFGSFELALHIWSADDIDDSPMPNAGLCLEVDEIEEMQALIEGNGGETVIVREPAPNVPARVASFRDPDGNGFDLRQHIAPARSP
jgi:predicted enzyme related to lactoylglutathione lyase